MTGQIPASLRKQNPTIGSKQRKDIEKIMEVKVNVLNEMKKLRSNTYADRYAWVEELIQNCQRSKSTRVDVTIDYDHVTVSDNGIGCNDPQVLFDKSSSGWDEETTTNESPFGEGFFSTMMVANVITVKSIGFTAIFDVNKMFTEKTVDAVEILPCRKRTGFSITLTNFTEEYYSGTTIDRFKEVAKYIKSPSIYINGEKVAYEGTAPKEDTPYVLKIDNEYFKGWICPHSYSAPNSWMYSSQIKCFAFDRLVKDSHYFSGVRGILTFKPNAINLRSPDRKEFIFDEKYETCLALFKEQIKKMYTKLVREGSDEDIKIFSEKVQTYLDLDDYKKHIKFKFLGKKTKPITVSQPTASEDVSDIEDLDSTPIDNIDDAPVTNCDDFGTVAYALPQVTPSSANTTSVKKRGRPAIQSAQTGELLDSKYNYAFYVESCDLDRYREHIDLAQYYDIPVIEIRNNLELSVIKNDPRTAHISEMQNKLKIVVEYRNMYPIDECEIRASKLLSRVAEALGGNSNMFVIADTTFRKMLTVNDKDFTVEEIDTFAAAYGNQIFINRTHMAAYDDLTDNSPELTDADIKFLLLNLKMLAHELSHVMFGTVDNTTDHESSTNNLMQKIIDLIYGKKRIRICA